MKTCLYYVKIRLHRSYVHANIGLSMFLKHALMKYPVFWRRKRIEKLAFERRKAKRVQMLFLVCIVKKRVVNKENAFKRVTYDEKCVYTRRRSRKMR